MNILRNSLQTIAWATRKMKFPGRERLLWRILNPKYFKARPCRYTIYYEKSLVLRVDISKFLDWALFFLGDHDAGVTWIIKKLIQKKFVAFDVGANLGCYALLMSLLVGESGRVFAFEPFPRMFKKVKKNIGLNRLKNIKVFPFALSDAAGTFPFYVPTELAVNQGEASFYKENASQEPHEIFAEAKTLDEVIVDQKCNRLDFIKIDTEGHEYRVLLGGKESIKKYKPYIVFEHDKRTWKNAGQDFKMAEHFLLEMNYVLYVINSNKCEKIQNNLPSFANILAVPPG